MPLADEELLVRCGKFVSSVHVVVTSILFASEGVSSMFRRCEEQFPGRSRSPPTSACSLCLATAHERCPKLASPELNLVSIVVVSFSIAGRLFLV